MDASKKMRNERNGTSVPYLKLVKMLDGMCPGTPLPAMNSLKKELGIGYLKLKEIFRELETEGRIIVRENLGTIVTGKTSPTERRHNTNIIPWASSCELTIRMVTDVTSEHAALWHELISRFNKCGGLCKIKLESIENAEFENIFHQPESWDIVLASSHLKRKKLCSQKEMFLNLDSFAKPHQQNGILYECIWDRDPASGIAVGVGPYACTTLLIYRKDILNKHKCSISSAPDANEIIEICRRLKNEFADGGRFIFLGYMSWFFRHGFKIFGAKENRAELSESKLRAVLDILRDMIGLEKHSPCFNNSLPYYSGSNNAGTCDCPLFETNSALNIKNSQYGYSMMPGNASRIEPVFFPSMCISRETLFPEECCEFLNFVLSEEGQKTVAKYSTGMPAMKDINPEGVDEDKLNAMKLALEYGRTAYEKSVSCYESRMIIERSLDKWFVTGGDLRRMLSETEARTNRFIKQHQDNP